MAFCIECGAKLEDGAKFCTVCGTRQPELAAPVYVPPTEEKPAEPQGYSYTPPASGGAGQKSGYNYDPTIYSGGGKKPEKPSGNKKTAIVFILLAALVVVGALVYILTSLRGSKAPADDPILGTYVAERAELAGTSISVKSIWEKGFSIELREKGKAMINVDGSEGSAKWTLDGESFTIKGSGVDCSGTLSGGILTLENVLDSGITLYFTKEGALIPVIPTEPAAPTPPSEPTPPPEPTPPSAPGAGTAIVPSGSDESVCGLYNAVKAEAYGIEVEITDMWEKGFSIELLDGGRCELAVNDSKGSGTWVRHGDAVTVNVPGFNMDGRITDDGMLVFENLYGMGVTLFFTRDGAAISADDPAAAVQTPADASEAPAENAWWSGDWYGWWAVVDAGGTYLDDGYVDTAWDCCAQIEVYDDGTGYVEIWDEDGDAVASAEVYFSDGGSDRGCMKNTAGNFFNHEFALDEWSVDPTDKEAGGFDNLICIRGRYTKPSNANDWIDYYIFLRPWGTRWEDIESGDSSGMVYPGDMMPINYTSWYLPLIEAGKPMPENFDGLN